MIQVPGYRILETLGSGASGTVYRAEQEALGRQVALKVLAVGLFDVEQTRARFLREARLQARLSHPRLLAVFDAGFAAGRPYLATELVEAGSLRSRLGAAGRLEPIEAARIARGIAEGLAAAHEAGIVHRDLKPENVLLTQAGEVKLADFGLAKSVEGGRTFQSAAGIVLGTPGYLAPEVVEGAAAGPAADLFALGAVLYEMLCGTTAWASDSDLARLFSEQREHRSRPLNPGVPARLAHLVTALLEPDPKERPASARVVIATLETYEQERSSESIDVSRPTTVVRAGLASQPRRTQLSGPPVVASARSNLRSWIAVAAAAVVLGLSMAGRQSRPLPAPRRAPAPPVRLPKIAAVFRGAVRAAFKLDDGAPPGSVLTVRSATGGWQRSIDLAPGARQAAVSGLADNQPFTAQFSASGASFTTSFSTLRRAGWGDAVAIQPTAVCAGVVAAARGPHIAVVGTNELPAGRDFIQYQESEDGGLTWGAIEAPLRRTVTFPVAAAVGQDAVYLSGYYIPPGEPGERGDAFVLRRDAGQAWSSVVTQPKTKWPCQTFLSRPPDFVELLYVDPTGQSIELATPESSAAVAWQGKPLAPSPANMVTLRVVRVGSRVLMAAQRLGNVFGFRMLDTTVVGANVPAVWSPLVDRRTRLGEYQMEACGQTTVVVYESDSKVVAQALANGAEKFSGPNSPLAVVDDPDARGCGLAVLQDRFYMASATKSSNLVVSLGGPDAIVVVSSADGLAWKLHRRVPVDLTGDIRCLSLVAVDDALVVLVSSRNDGVFAMRVGLR